MLGVHSVHRQAWVLIAVVILACCLPSALAVATTIAPWGTFDGFPVVKLVVNGKQVEGDVPAVNVKGRTLIPLRLAAETLGATVGWDAETYTATLDVDLREPVVPSYSSWTLTEAEVADAIMWARSGKGLEQEDILPMYIAEINNEVTLKLFTPWATAVALAHGEIKYEQALTATPADLIAQTSGEMRVIVIVYSSRSLPSFESVTLTQGNATYTPVHAFDPIERAWHGGQYAALQEYIFDATVFDKTGVVYVRVLVDGYEYVYSWDLASIK
ncbi:MAG TPA: hypothetical protein DHW14_09360 [Clostridiales bacterium]|nr:hypothetical protein [Clostridiales bacterium]